MADLETAVAEADALTETSDLDVRVLAASTTTHQERHVIDIKFRGGLGRRVFVTRIRGLLVEINIDLVDPDA